MDRPPTELGYIVGEKVRYTWDFNVIGLSLLVALVGAFTTLTICDLLKHCDNLWWYRTFIMVAGISFGLCTVWCMHFIGMNALTLDGGQVSGARGQIYFSYEIWLTVISGAAAWFIASLGLYIMTGRKMGDRSKVDKHMLVRLGLAGSCLAVGVVSMHYLGMVSQSGFFIMEYDVGIVAASVMVACVVSVVGLLILVFFRNDLGTRLLSAALISGAVNSMHYIGMLSATYTVAAKERVVMDSTAVHIDGLVAAVVALVVNNFLYIVISRYTSVIKKNAEAKAKEEVRIKNLVKSALTCLAQLSHPMHVTPMPRFNALSVDDICVEKGAPKKPQPSSEELIILHNTEDVMSFKESGNYLVFFSYEILKYMSAGPNDAQLQAMKRALLEISYKEQVRLSQIFVWLDCLSIPQYNSALMKSCIGALYNFARLCDSMVIICPETKHSTLDTVADHRSVRRRLWCRVEHLSFCAAHGVESMYLHKGEHLEELDFDWIDSICNVFDSDSTCCRLKHPDGMACDRQNVVLPLLALCYCQFRRKSQSGMSTLMSELLAKNIDVMFPETIRYETQDGSEMHELFGASISLLESIAKVSSYDLEQIKVASINTGRTHEFKEHVAVGEVGFLFV